MNCPKCGGEVYDNRADKASGTKSYKWPDYKCKDKACDWAEWEKKKDAPAKPAARAPAGPKWTWPALQELYRNSLRIAAPLVKTLVPNATSDNVVSVATTIFIAATKDGVQPPPQPLTEKPTAIAAAEAADKDDLGW